MNKLVIPILVCFFALASVTLFANNSGTISIHHGKYSDYYHIKYQLKKSNFTMSKTPVRKDGQFEIYINKNKFPVPANNCKGMLILRMPSTLSDSEYYKESIQKKKLLYDKIKNIYTNNKGSIDVIIELNPYVIVKSKNPSNLELENCNIFFRTKKNNYVNTL